MTGLLLNRSLGGSLLIQTLQGLTNAAKGTGRTFDVMESDAKSRELK